jgi:dynein heavy chain 1
MDLNLHIYRFTTCYKYFFFHFQAIFNHLRKIRNTKYPIQRALRLVEAISRDLVNQMLKVLGTRRLMYIGFDEFEKVPNF